jgi:hypothetical protein
VNELIGFHPADQEKSPRQNAAISVPAPHFHRARQTANEASYP